MKLDTSLDVTGVSDLASAAEVARAAEEIGFHALWTTEAQHDPFLPVAAASTSTRRIELGTAIALAFTRSPTVLAHVAWDLQASTKGRFVLGLGTQVKGHNERRFGVRWESPGKKLREVVLAIRAVWDTWQTGKPLDFRGEFFTLTLMTPFFNPGPLEYPRPPIFLAGVNPYVTCLAGEVADGFHVHPLHSVKYLREHVLPEIERGAAKSGRSRRDLQLATMAFVIVGDSRRELEEMRERTRQQISFYASTRTYKPMLDAHGWGDTCLRLNEKAARGDWKGMAGEITDEMLAEFAVEGPADEIAARLKAKYSGLIDRLAFYFPFHPGENDARWKKIVEAFQE
jgi:probable F420-dependent oxidoreductase